MKFGEKVRAARLAAHYSQRQLADMTGIALRTIQNWIAKEKNRKFVPKKYRSTSDSNSDS